MSQCRPIYIFCHGLRHYDLRHYNSTCKVGKKTLKLLSTSNQSVTCPTQNSGKCNTLAARARYCM